MCNRGQKAVLTVGPRRWADGHLEAGARMVVSRRRIRDSILLLTLLGVLLAAPIHAAETGKIAGTSREKRSKATSALPDSTVSQPSEQNQPAIGTAQVEINLGRFAIQLDEASPRHIVIFPRIRVAPMWGVISCGGPWYRYWVRRRHYHYQFQLRPGPADEFLYVVDGVSMKDSQGSVESLNTGSDGRVSRPVRR